MLADFVVEDYITTLLGSDGDARQHLVAGIVSDIKEGRNQLVPLQIAIIARRLHGVETAITLAENFLHEAGVRKLLLREIGGYLAHSGHPERALQYLAPGVEEALFHNDDILFTASQYARSDQRSKANSLVDIVALNLDSATSAQVHRQFHQFLWQFDCDMAKNMFDTMRSLFKTAHLSEVEQDIHLALQTRQPYLLLRLGDGEGSYIKIDTDDETRYKDLYRSNRLEFIDIWFKDNLVLDDPKFNVAIDLFNRSYNDADYIGSISAATDVAAQYTMGSKRGIPALVNIMRGLVVAAQQNSDWAKGTILGGITIHYNLLLSGALKRLLQGRAEIGLISCHARLPEALKRTYGIACVEFYKVPGEQIHTTTLGKAALEGHHWPDRFDEICQKLDEAKDRHGQLFLVAAGLLGKIYAAKLKKSGAVVLDIGAVVDLWMGKITRSFPALPDDVKLDLGPPRLVLVDVGGLGGIAPEWADYMEDVRVVVFEPNLAAIDAVKRSASENPGSTVYGLALSNKTERRSLNVAKSLGCTSLLVPNLVFLERYSISPAFRVIHTIEVDCIRYDELMVTGQAPSPDVLKVSVQGFEYEVLEGFGDTLTNCLAVKVVCHLYPIYIGQKLFHDIIAYLSRFGLLLRMITPVNNFDGDVVELEAYFTRGHSEVYAMNPHTAANFELIEKVWKLPKNRQTFGPDQFS